MHGEQGCQKLWQLTKTMKNAKKFTSGLPRPHPVRPDVPEKKSHII